MTIRETAPMQMLCFSEKVNFASMIAHVRVKSRELYAASQAAGLEVTGPLYWIYHGSDGNPDTEFLLDIGLPVTPAEGINSEFRIKQFPLFKCASILHQGPWGGFPEIYGRLLGEIQALGYELSGENREIYLNMDFNQEAHNITEIQIGIR